MIFKQSEGDLITPPSVINGAQLSNKVGNKRGVAISVLLASRADGDGDVSSVKHNELMFSLPFFICSARATARREEELIGCYLLEN